MISVIIPLYNKELSIARTLRSVLAQEGADYEAVVVNDGSTDSSAGIVRSMMAERGAGRLRLVEQENAGPSAARNRGVREALGEWVLPIDADDELLPGALSRFAEAAREHPEADMLLGEVVINERGCRHVAVRYGEGQTRRMSAAHALGRLMQCSGSTVYRRGLCLRFPYDESLRRYEDFECLFRKYRASLTRFVPHPVAVVNTEFAEASRGRRDVMDDFTGHIDLRGKAFWERVCLYLLFLSERPHYTAQLRRLRPDLYRRRDLLLCAKAVSLIRCRPRLLRLALRLLGLGFLAPVSGRRACTGV